MHLSGRVDQLNDHHPEIILKGIDVYKDIRQDLRFGTPFWPLGSPKWSGGWISVGSRCSDRLSYVSVWRRESTAPDSIELSVPKGAGTFKTTLAVLYPAWLPVENLWDKKRGSMTVKLPCAPSARLFRVDFTI